MSDVTPTTMHIGELADKTGMSLRTIRHYDDVGLLKPTGRTDGGFRLYTEADFARLMVIRRMKPLGFTLEEMADLLRVVDRLDGKSGDQAQGAARADLDDFIQQAVSRRVRLEEQLGMADEFIQLLRSQ